MKYAELVGLYDRLAATDSTNEKRSLLAEAFTEAGEQLDRLVVLVRGRLWPAYDRAELGVSSSLTLAAIATATGVDESRLRERWSETGDLGDVAAWATDDGGQQTLLAESLTVERVHETLRELASFSGPGSQDRRVDAVAGLLADAAPEEARYVVRTALGHLRVGVGEGTIRDAVAEAFLDGSEAAVAAVERAYQVTTDFQLVARTARAEGRDGLAALSIELGRPIQVMLAETAASVSDGLAAVADDGLARCEYKYDGFRVQAHVGEEVALFTRRLEEVTEQFPDVVRAIDRGVAADRLVLDGELVGYTPETIAAAPDEREPLAFQELSRRIKRESRIVATARELPVVFHAFDCLYDRDETLLSTPLAGRYDRLEAVTEPVSPDPAAGVAGFELARSLRVAEDDPERARTLYDEALAAGHEGLMLKNPGAVYEPGRRVGRLLKLKPTMEPLDLVVTRAKYSEGRRSQLLGRLYLACYDPEADALREVGRLSTGYTDDELAALTERLEALIVERDGRAVELEPSVVLEVEYEEIQASSEYDSGYALRFPRYRRTRETLAPEDADTLDRIERLYESQ